MKISLIMCILRILTDLCVIKQKIFLQMLFTLRTSLDRTQGKLFDNKW